MKTLIISSGRAGSTSLQMGLHASIKGSTICFEPFSDRYEPFINNKDLYNEHLLELIKITEPLIVKSLIFQPSHNHTEFIDKTPNFYIDFYLNYMTYFDKHILLMRKDQVKTSESLAFSITNDKWHEPYTYSLNKDTTPELNKVKLYNSILEKISTKTNIPITYYEDLFTGDKSKIDYFLNQNEITLNNYEALYDHLDPKYKLRKN